MDEYARMIVETMGFSYRVEIKKKKGTQFSRKRRDSCGHKQARPLLSGRKRTHLNDMPVLHKPMLPPRTHRWVKQISGFNLEHRHFKRSNAMIK
jgi:hypothetical protein